MEEVQSSSRGNVANLRHLALPPLEWDWAHIRGMPSFNYPSACGWGSNSRLLRLVTQIQWTTLMSGP